MEHKRKFLIQITDKENYPDTFIYVHKIIKGSIGYFCTITRIKEGAKIFKYRRNCEKNIYKLQHLKDPTKKRLNRYIYETIEVTDNQTLRNIKLKKLNKK